jgi:hypothetical protein
MHCSAVDASTAGVPRAYSQAAAIEPRREVDPMLQHKNHTEVLVDGQEIVVRPVRLRQG